MPAPLARDGVDLVRRRVRRVHQLPARVERAFARPAIRSAARRWRRGSRRPRRSARRRGCGSAPAIAVGERRQRRDRRRRSPRAANGSRRRRRRSGRPRARMPSRSASTSSAARRRKRRWSSRSAGCGEAGALVQHRQQRQADAGVVRRHRRAPTTSPAGRRSALPSGVVVQVVELADLRVAAAQQLDVELRRDRAQLLGRDAQRHARTCGRARTRSRRSLASRRSARPAKARWKAWLCALTRPGSSGPASTRRAGGRRGDAGRDLGPAAVGAGAQQHVVAPAAWQPGARRPETSGRVGGSASAHRRASRASSAPARAAPAAARGQRVAASTWQAAAVSSM